MNCQYKVKSKKVLFLFSFLMLFGCAATTREPMFLSDSFSEERIDKIIVFPVVDLRFEKQKELASLDKWVHGKIKGALKPKKYEFSLLKDRELVNDITEEDLADPNPDWIRQLGASDYRWIFLPILNDATSKTTFGSTGNAVVSAVLLDKQKASVIWKDKAIGRKGQGGLIGMAMKGKMEQAAIEKATKELMKSFPKSGSSPKSTSSSKTAGKH